MNSVPGAVQEPVASGVARLLVFDPRIEGSAFVGPLARPVVTGDRAEFARSHRVSRSFDRRPVSGAGTVADGLAWLILVEDVNGHAARVGQHRARGGRVRGKRRSLMSHRLSAEQKCGRRTKPKGFH